jgi:hypothetical protein
VLCVAALYCGYWKVETSWQLVPLRKEESVIKKDRQGEKNAQAFPRCAWDFDLSQLDIRSTLSA